MACNVRQNTLNHMQEGGYLGSDLTILTPDFFAENHKFSDLARTKYGVTNSASLYTWKGNRAIPDEAFFTELQERHTAYHNGTPSDSIFRPEDFARPSKVVDYKLKPVDLLQSDRAKDVFTKGVKNNWTLDKVLNEIGGFADYKQLFDKGDLEKSVRSLDRNELAIDIAGKYTYTVEIETATEMKNVDAVLDDDGNVITEGGMQEMDADIYSSISIIGGVRYQENNINTPLIIPRVKGHAQFANRSGIGWFRTDEQRSDDNTGKKIHDGAGGLVQQGMIGSKTRRVLEVQSDLFQKNRDEEVLAGEIPDVTRLSKEQVALNGDYVEYRDSEFSDTVHHIVYKHGDRTFQIMPNGAVHEVKKGVLKKIKTSDLPEGFVTRLKAANQEVKDRSVQIRQGLEQERDSIIEQVVTSSENKFLQLLNKANNWVAFFIRAIIQDSIKKGYEKVVFPVGDTASKIEGQETVEQYVAYRKKSIEQIDQDLQDEEVEKYYQSMLENARNHVASKEIVPPRKLITDKPHDFYIHRQVTGTKHENSRVRRNLDHSMKLDLVNDPSYSGWVLQEYTVRSEDREKIVKITPEQAQAYLDKDRQYTEKSRLGDLSNARITLREIENNKEGIVRDRIENLRRAKEQYEHELANADTSVFSAIHNFYERTIYNVLKNRGFNPTRITDQFGNGWYEVSLKGVGNNILLQTSSSNVTPSKASPKTLQKLKDFLNKIGIDVQTLKELKIAGTNIGLNGLTDPLNRLIQIAEGKEDVALPEEAMHIVVEILKQKDPTLYKQMLNKVGGYAMYNNVFDEYSKLYTTEEGKPDVRRIKDEAIGKLLAEYYVQKFNSDVESEEKMSFLKAFWQKVVLALKKLFNTAGFNPFEEAIKSIEDLDARGIEFRGDKYYQVSDAQAKLLTKFGQTARDVIKVVTKTAKNDPLSDVAEDNHYEFNGKRILHRVTDRVKRWYNQRYGEKRFTENEVRINETLRKYGTAAHEDLKNIMDRYTDDEKKRRVIPLPVTRPILTSKPIYDKLEFYIRELLATYDEDTIFVTELVVFKGPPGREERGEAGTIDFMAISKEGEVEVLDWKFMRANAKVKDVQWYKREAYEEQLKGYKELLRGYGVTRIKKLRLIPFVMGVKVYIDGNKSVTSVAVTDILAGDADPKKIKDLRVLPVASKDERTGVAKIDDYINRLFSIYDKLSRESVKDKQKGAKAEQLNQIMKTIRKLQVQQDLQALAEEAVVLSKKIDFVIKRYNEKFKDKKFTDFTREQIDEFAGELNAAKGFTFLYKRVDSDLESLIDMTTEEGQKIYKDLTDAANTTRKHEDEILRVSNEFGQKFLGDRFSISDLATPEKVANWLVRNFRPLSKAKTAVTQVLYNLVNEAVQRIEIRTDTQNKILRELHSRYKEMADKNHWNSDNMYNILLRRRRVDGKDMYEHRLLDELDDEAIFQFNKAREAVDVEWFNKNINLEAYMKDAKEEVERVTKDIQEAVLYGTEAEVAKTKRDQIKSLIERYDITINPNAYGNYIMMQHIRRDIWESADYKKLKANPVAFEFYNYIRDLNERAVEMGYVPPREGRFFLPFVYKTSAQELMSGNVSGATGQALRSISTSVAQVNYGATDPETGKPVLTIPKYYTEHIGDPIKDEKGEPRYDDRGRFLYIDSSAASRELFEIVAKYAEQVERYSEMEKIEQSAKLLSTIEENKGSLETGTFGTLLKRGAGQAVSTKNEENLAYLENFIKMAIYDQASTDAKFDQAVGTITSKFNGFINEKLKMKLLPEDIEERKISVVKALDQSNRWFQLKTLGINLGSSISTFLGGNFQAIINSGKAFSGKEFLASEMRVAMAKFQGEEGKKRFALLDYFFPVSELVKREDLKKLGDTLVTQNSLADFVMILMRSADNYVQYTIADAYVSNMIIIDGKMVNAREWYMKSKEYMGRYSLPESERMKLESGFAKKVEELKKQHGILKSVEFDKDGNVSIKGFERLSEDVMNNRQAMRLLIRSATGNVAKEDKNQISMTVLGRSFMVFKNWIPPLIDTRFGEFEYNTGKHEYEWGRIRMTIKFILEDKLHAIQNIRNVIKGNDKGIELLRKFYDEKKEQYEAETGKEFKITSEEFYDLVRKNLRDEMKEFAFVVTLLGMYLSVYFAGGSGDDRRKKKKDNFYKLALKYLDKVSDEVLFYYNPDSFMKVVGGSYLPSVGLFGDLMDVPLSIMKEIFGDGDKADLEPLKYTLRNVPVAKEFVNWVPFISDDLAKELNIHVTSQSRR